MSKEREGQKRPIRKTREVLGKMFTVWDANLQDILNAYADGHAVSDIIEHFPGLTVETLTRIAAEHGLVKKTSYKTIDETKLLEYLARKDINTIDDAKRALILVDAIDLDFLNPGDTITIVGFGDLIVENSYKVHAYYYIVVDGQTIDGYYFNNGIHGTDNDFNIVAVKHA